MYFCEKMMSNIFLALTVLFLTTNASAKSNLIVGGDPIEIEEAPYQVSLQVSRLFFGPRHSCGGSIISEKFIVTAAHCVEPDIPHKYTVLAGSSFHNKPGQRVKVKRFISHEDYGKLNNIDNDIALVELATPLTVSESVKVIALPKMNETISDETKCLVSGWGVTNRFEWKDRSKLRAVEVPIFNFENCKKSYGEKVTPRMICAGYEEGGKDACPGDSGGPLKCSSTDRDGTPTLYGIVSWGFDCALPRYPGVYTRVTALREWIHNKTGL